ncbi:MAG: DUF4230 domain-containing protein [Anaerolineae bacterium]|nr:DUF4230 domain-containing protein [Anaerolineae bacterium]
MSESGQPMKRLLLTLGIVLVAAVAAIGGGACWLGYRVTELLTPPTPTPVPPPVVHVEQIRQAAELATVKSTMSTDITSTRVPDDLRQLLGVREEIVLIAYGEVAAGFDLSKLGEDDLWTDGARVQLHLPSPEILYTRLDNERTHIVYYARSFLVERDLDLEGRARAEAEEAIREAALDSDLLYQARRYGEAFFSSWFYSMGFTEVQIIID